MSDVDYLERSKFFRAVRDDPGDHMEAEVILSDAACWRIVHTLLS